MTDPSAVFNYVHQFTVGEIPVEIDLRSIIGGSTNSINVAIIGGVIFTDPIPKICSKNWLGIYSTVAPLNSANSGGLLYSYPDPLDPQTLIDNVFFFFDVAPIAEYGDFYNRYNFIPTDRISFTLPPETNTVKFFFSSPDNVGDISNESGFISYFRITMVDNVETYGQAQQVIQQEEELIPSFTGDLGSTPPFGYVVPNS